MTTMTEVVANIGGVGGVGGLWPPQLEPITETLSVAHRIESDNLPARCNRPFDLAFAIKMQYSTTYDQF